MKGILNGICNREACDSTIKVLYLNKYTGKHYCKRCAMRINELNGEEVCTKDKS